MRIVDIRERTVPISRYADPALPSGGLTTSIVAVVTDAVRDGEPVTGYGFASFGRFGQGGLIRERFAPRLLAADDLGGDRLDPFHAWTAMMAGEKPGGHGERCVAVGALDMAVWDAAAKLDEQPLYRHVAERTGRPLPTTPDLPVYAGGGYVYPKNDIARLTDEVRRHLDAGYDRVKIKTGGASLTADMARIEAVLTLLPAGDRLAVDAMNAYDASQALEAATTLAPLDLMWFEDICDPLDLDTHAQIAAGYRPPIAAGEAMFSAAEARLLFRHGGLRPDRDILLFDPAHCYGLPGYLEIIAAAEAHGWSRRAFWPHGGHLFSLHVAYAFGLGGSEINPASFPPFGSLADGAVVTNGRTAPPDAPGIGFETKAELIDLFRNLVSG